MHITLKLIEQIRKTKQNDTTRAFLAFVPTYDNDIIHKRCVVYVRVGIPETVIIRLHIMIENDRAFSYDYDLAYDYIALSCSGNVTM